ncbi:nuclear transport factor 2 family protein [Myxococcus landrumensis]|uniref:Nuclear transport factor 2 family protein n=1 Tax=Myxococcus landrumensis TaxID=2813577 RepID=A0ABX7NFA6_9BACT|nr:nuclear transport factor 2 family protein [Myxococcus landrumus]QSQ17502.1 nuclear transport factor 2 family protein [Myxococcus landrumus]
MNAIEAIVQRYLATFNETDEARRGAALRELYTEDCAYTDPLVAATGTEAISGFIGGIQKQYPGLVFTLAGPVDAHHDQARFTWHAGMPGGDKPLVMGFDVVALSNGRIRQVFGFLNAVPA